MSILDDPREWMGKTPDDGRRVRVMDGKRELGTVPRRGMIPCNAHRFVVEGATHNRFVLLYGTRTVDEGWFLELVLEAGGADIDLLERIPGWLTSSS